MLNEIGFEFFGFMEMASTFNNGIVLKMASRSMVIEYCPKKYGNCCVILKPVKDFKYIVAEHIIDDKYKSFVSYDCI
jgi:hypothetical protein